MRKAYVKNNQAALYGIMLREVLIMYIIISISIIVSAYMIYNQMENMSRIYSCALDGIVVWCTSSMLNLGLLPVIISVFLHMHYDIYMRNVCVIKQKSRTGMWFNEQKLSLVICAVVFTWSMMLSFVLAYIMNRGNIYANVSDDLFFTNTYYGIMLSQCTDIQSGQETLIPAINIVWVIIRVWLINMLQLYMVVMAADVIYWLSGKRLFSTIILSAMCMITAIFPKSRRYAYVLGIKVKAYSYYLEVLNINVWLKHIFIMLIIILLTNVVMSFVVKNKDMVM